MSRIEEAADLVDGQGLGQVTPLTRSVQCSGHVRPNGPLGERVLMQSTDRGGRAGNGRGRSRFTGHVAGGQTHRVVLDVSRAHVRDSALSTSLHVKRVASRISTIVRNCMRRRHFFNAQIIHPLVNESFQRRHSDRVSDCATYVRERYRHAHIFARL